MSFLGDVTIAKTWSMPSEHVQTFAEMTSFFHTNKDTLDLTGERN